MGSIDFHAVSLARDGRAVLHDISLHLPERRVALIGANGSGKSTFARMLNGLLLPDQGRVEVDGRDTRQARAELCRRVGFLFQEPDLQLVMPTVEEELRFGLDNLGLAETEQRIRLDAIMARFDIADWRDRNTYSLSSGQKQLLALCSVLIMEPDRLVLDEPGTRLDRLSRLRLNHWLDELDLPMVEISHELDRLARFERVLVMDAGHIVFDGAPVAAREHYELLIEKLLHSPAETGRS